MHKSKYIKSKRKPKYALKSLDDKDMNNTPIYSIIDKDYEPSKLPPISSKLIEKMYEEISKLKEITPESFYVITKKLGIKYLTPGDYKRLIRKYPNLQESFIYDPENNVYLVKIFE